RVAVREGQPRPQAGQERQRARLVEVGQQQSDAIFVVERPVAARQGGPAAQVQQAVLAVGDQLAGGGVERRRPPFAEPPLLRLVPRRQVRERLPVLEGRVGTQVAAA